MSMSIGFFFWSGCGLQRVRQPGDDGLQGAWCLGLGALREPTGPAQADMTQTRLSGLRLGFELDDKADLQLCL